LCLPGISQTFMQQTDKLWQLQGTVKQSSEFINYVGHLES
jgi:hypothetical protein